MALADAAAPVIEALDPRRLLSTVTYYVPANDAGGNPVTYIELKHDVAPGLIDVYLNHSPTRSYEFTNTSGTDVIQSGNTGVTCEDR